ILGSIFILGGAWMCWHDREARLTYVIGTVGLLAFFYSKYIGYSRHQGFLFFNLVFALWMGGMPRRKWVVPMLAGLLIYQIGGSAVAAYYDCRYSFSCGKAVAQYITTNHLEDFLLAAGPDYMGVPVAGYLRQPFYSA